MGDDIKIESTTDTQEQINAALARETEGEEASAENAEGEAEEGESSDDSSEGESEGEGEAGEGDAEAEGESDDDESDDDSEEEDSDEDDDEEGDEVEDRPRKRRSKEWRRRVSKLTAIRYQQQEEIDRLNRENEELRSGRTTEGTDQEKADDTGPKFDKAKPKIDDYDTVEEWTEALTDWKVEKAEFERSTKSAIERQQASQSQLRKAHDARVEEYRKKNPDFDKARQRALDMKLPMPPLMGEHILHSEMGPDLTYYLATHPDECRRIAALPAGPMLVSLGEIQAQLKLEKKGSVRTPSPKMKKKPSAPPPPINPVRRGASAVNKSVDQMTQREYNEWRRQGGGRR